MRAYVDVVSQDDYDAVAQGPGRAIARRNARRREGPAASVLSRLRRGTWISQQLPATVSIHAGRTSFLRKHIFSLDHKVIGKQYLDLALVAVLTGMVLSWFMRFHLAFPNSAVPVLGTIAPKSAAGGIMTPEMYLALMTMHGTIMVFFVLTTAPFAGFGNYVLPIQVGAEDMAFPRFNMMSFWVTCVAFLVLIAAFFVPDGPPIAGWTAYAPLSAVGIDAGPGHGARA